MVYITRLTNDRNQFYVGKYKGMFIADFKLAIRPLYTELADAIFHPREPSCIVTCAPCNTYDYSAQDYNSCPDACT